jgi:hypothetical protein
MVRRLLEKLSSMINENSEKTSDAFLFPEVTDLKPSRVLQKISKQELFDLRMKINEQLKTGMTRRNINQILRPYGYFLGKLPKGSKASDNVLEIKRFTDHKVMGSFRY